MKRRSSEKTWWYFGASAEVSVSDSIGKILQRSPTELRSHQECFIESVENSCFSAGHFHNFIFSNITFKSFECGRRMFLYFFVWSCSYLIRNGPWMAPKQSWNSVDKMVELEKFMFDSTMPELRVSHDQIYIRFCSRFAPKLLWDGTWFHEMFDVLSGFSLLKFYHES